MSFTSRDLAPRDRYLQRRCWPIKDMHHLPRHRRIDERGRLHGSLYRARLVEQHDRRRGGDRAHRSSTWTSSRRLGHKHYQALESPRRRYFLRSLYIDRIYDTYIDEVATPALSIGTIGEIAEQPGSEAPTAAAPSSARWASGSPVEARQEKAIASSSSPTSTTCRSSARRSPIRPPASASSSIRSRRMKAKSAATWSLDSDRRLPRADRD